MKAYSLNNDDQFVHYESLNDFVNDCDDIEPGDSYCVGDMVKFLAKDMVSAGGVIDMIQEEAYNLGGEYADDFLEKVSEEQEEELLNIIAGWIEKNENIDFFNVVNVQTYEFTKEDLGIE